MLGSGVWKRDPDLADLVRFEVLIEPRDVGTQERHVVHPLRGGVGAADPDAGAPLVDTDHVAVRRPFCERDGIFTAATAKLDHQRVMGREDVPVPAASNAVEPRLSGFEEIVQAGVGEEALALVSHGRLSAPDIFSP